MGMVRSLPQPLEDAIRTLLSQSNSSSKRIASAAQDLSGIYRAHEFEKALHSTEQVLAYAATRLSATYGVAHRVLSEITSLSMAGIRNLVDLGSGPGTVLWAAQALFPELVQATLIEQNQGMIRMGEKLAEKVKEKRLHVSWKQASLEKISELPPVDLVVMSYSLGEINDKTLQESIAVKAFKAAKHFLAIMEPGTPQGFQTMKAIRDQLIRLGGFVAGPCTHNNPCPLSDKDWCHFSASIGRASYHRRMKNATLPHEDEKFTYLIISKDPKIFQQITSTARIIKKPLKRAGHVRLDICDSSGIRRVTYSRRHKGSYEAAKDMKWGARCQR